MLPSDLLIVWKRRGMIWPRYVKPSDENLRLATSLIGEYRSHVGEKKGTLKGLANELEETGYDHRLVRGLSLLLDRKSIFRCDDKVEPIGLRRMLFCTAERRGRPTNPEQRQQIIEAVSSDLKISVETVEKSFYADLDSELVLTEFSPPVPTELLKEYNLSLTQTLLFDSTELNFTASGNWQRIFHAIKRLGLIYEVTQDSNLWVKIDGPVSLFKLTRRYGIAIAKLLPEVIANPTWRIEAKILWKYTNEICDFKIESWRHDTLLGEMQIANVSYDSAVEEDFASRFQASKSEWHLKREPTPLQAGRQVMIPDFSFEREKVKVYMEVVGFWTREYLTRKIEKLSKINANMMVAVNQTLACEKLTTLEEQTPRLTIIYYRDKIPLAPIHRYLEEAFRDTLTKQAELVKSLPIVFTEPIIEYEEFAARIGVSTEAARTALKEKSPQDYVMLASSLVKRDKLEQIGKRIDDEMEKTKWIPLSEAVKIIETEGVGDATGVLETLEYRIVWHGISPEKAEVYKPENKHEQ